MSENEKKSRISVSGKVKPQINRYYLRVSRGYMIFGIAFMLMLFMYIVCVTAFFGEYVTYDNMKYLVRDFNSVSFGSGGELSDIVYNGNDDTKFIRFKNGLALTDGDWFSYYDSSGVLLIDEDIEYENPVITASDKYILVYDMGGTGYSVFNQITRIIEREADGKIISADIADDGSCILVTRSRETRFVATIYNSAFNPSMKIYKENYVMASAASPSGNNYVIASVIPSGSDFICEIALIKKGSSENTALLKYEHTMPLSVEASEDGFSVLCDNGLYYFDYEGHLTSSAGFSGMNLKYADIGKKSSLIVGTLNALGSENRVLVLSETGEAVCDVTVKQRISGAAASGDLSNSLGYIKTADSILEISTDKTFRTVSYDGAMSDVLSILTSERGVVVASKSGAKTVLAEDE